MNHSVKFETCVCLEIIRNLNLVKYVFICKTSEIHVSIYPLSSIQTTFYGKTKSLQRLAERNDL